MILSALQANYLTGMTAFCAAAQPLDDLLQGLQSSSPVQRYLAARSLSEIISGDWELGPVQFGVSQYITDIVEGYGQGYGQGYGRINPPYRYEAIQRAAPAMQGLISEEDLAIQRYRQLTASLPRVVPPFFAADFPFVVESKQQSELLRFVSTHPAGAPIQEIEFLVGRESQNLSDRDFRAITRRLWGRAVSLSLIHTVFQIGIEGYQTGHLQMIICGLGILFKGTITTDAGQPVGSFKRVIPNRPDQGSPWIARGEGFNLRSDDKQDVLRGSHDGKGIARWSRLRLIGFLYSLGVDRLDLRANGVGRYAWPRMGLDFSDAEIREIVLVCFAEYLRSKDILLSLEQERHLFAIRRAWDLTDFEVDGRRLGKEFLLDPNLRDQEFDLRFHLANNYEGWLYLLKPLMDRVQVHGAHKIPIQ